MYIDDFNLRIDGKNGRICLSNPQIKILGICDPPWLQLCEC